jgi:Na+/H+-dicarboxylate symporter
MLTKDDLEKERRSEYRMRYQFIAAQIDTIKRHQWDMTHYALLMFAGIVGITTLIQEKNLVGCNLYLPFGILLWILDTYILVFIIYMMCRYQRNLVANRRDSIALENKFETCIEIRKETIPSNYFNFTYQGEILFTFIFSIFLGYGFSMLYVFRKLINLKY